MDGWKRANIKCIYRYTYTRGFSVLYLKDDSIGFLSQAYEQGLTHFIVKIWECDKEDYENPDNPLTDEIVCVGTKEQIDKAMKGYHEHLVSFGIQPILDSEEEVTNV